jgi:hypothetical protein
MDLHNIVQNILTEIFGGQSGFLRQKKHSVFNFNKHFSKKEKKYCVFHLSSIAKSRCIKQRKSCFYFFKVLFFSSIKILKENKRILEIIQKHSYSC